MIERCSVIELFTRQAYSCPDAIAVICKKEHITYGALNENAERLACCLRDKGVVQDTLVPILLEDGIDIIIAILGILKAGGAFVPIDPSYPAERIAYVLEDTGCNIVIVNRCSAEKLSSGSYDHLLIDEDALSSPCTYTSLIPQWPALSSLAYVIYTSGSTGKPKGVMVEHAQLITYLLDVCNRFVLADCNSYAILGTFSADAGYTAIFAALCFGKRLTVINIKNLPNFDELIHGFETFPVDCYKTTPSLLQLFLQNKEAYRVLPLKKLILGGEACPWPLANEIFDILPQGCRLFNHYGPTETTVGVVTYAFPKEKTGFPGVIPLGKPLENVKTHILTENRLPVTDGAPGELYIEGPLVARGYLKNPVLTAERFITLHIKGQPHRMYRTGDIVRTLPDGNIEYIGRIDEQVKLLGNRIELKEIEEAALGSGLVSKCVVLARKNSSGGYYLAGYMTPRPDTGTAGTGIEPEATACGGLFAALTAALHRKLPAYMVPQKWAIIYDWPLTFNNKINRTALPEIEQAATEPAQNTTATVNTVEATLTGIWQHILKIATISTTDNFFELGGNSLQLITLCFEIFKHLQTEVTAMELFEHLTIQRQAAYLAQKTDMPEGTGGFPDGFAENEASDTQKTMFIQNLLNPALSFPNSSISFEIIGIPDCARLELAFTKIIVAHESLRTTYAISAGKVYKKLHTGFRFNIEIVKKEGIDIDEAIIALTKPFNFGVLPLIRVFIVGLADGRSFLHIDMPHINSDGESLKIIMHQLEAIYNETEIARRRPQYTDFQKQAYYYRHSLQFKADERFWHEQLSKNLDVPLLSSGSAFIRPGFEGTYFVSTLPAELHAKADRYIRANRLTKFQLFLGIYLLTLYKTTSARNTLVMLPVHNRNEKEMEGVIGLLSNVLLLSRTVDPRQSIKDYLISNSKAILDVLRHQRFPFERQTEILKEAGMDIRKVFHSFFGYHQSTDTYRLGNSILKLYIPLRNKENLPLSMAIFETGSGITLRWSSKSGFYNAAGLKAIALLYSQILGQMLTSDQSLPIEGLLNGEYTTSFNLL